MRPQPISLVTAVVALLLGFATAAIAQTAAPPSPMTLGPTSPIAPSADVPAFGLGGIGAGNVPVAPGAAPTGENLELIGPGGGRIAPGLAAPSVSAPALPRSPVR
jgi:hypothetical protein